MASKTDILDEIKRTAFANGGKPLGVAKFERETGIKEYDWGRHWARFGDAQKEAGFERNEMQGAEPDSVLIEKLIALTRKLGKFPTYREIEVERFSGGDLPSKKVFQRLGGKRKVRLAQMVLAHCAGREEFQDVVALCEAISKEESDDSKDVTAEDVSLGEVYLFKSGKFHKIGRTSDTVRRGSEIRVQLPEKVTLIHSIKTDDPSGIEAYWHRRFEAKRMNGERFDLSPADVRAFKRWRRIA